LHEARNVPFVIDCKNFRHYYPLQTLNLLIQVYKSRALLVNAWNAVGRASTFSCRGYPL